GPPPPPPGSAPSLHAALPSSPLPGPATAAAGCGDSAAAAPQPPGSPWFQPGDGTGPTDRPRPGYSAGLSQSAAQTRHHCPAGPRSEEHTSELQSRENLVCRRL